MLFSLIALTILSLGAVTLVRSVDTTTLVFGNLSFKQDATVSSNGAAEAAIAWMAGRNLNDSIPSAGYHANSLDNLDPTGGSGNAALAVVDWANGDCLGITNCVRPSAPISLRADGTVTARYVISRICSSDGVPGSVNSSGVAVSCSKPPESTSTGTAVSRDELGGAPIRPVGSTSGPYYRILVRTVVNNTTVSFTETIVHF